MILRSQKKGPGTDHRKALERHLNHQNRRSSGKAATPFPWPADITEQRRASGAPTLVDARALPKLQQCEILVF